MSLFVFAHKALRTFHNHMQLSDPPSRGAYIGCDIIAVYDKNEFDTRQQANADKGLFDFTTHHDESVSSAQNSVNYAQALSALLTVACRHKSLSGLKIKIVIDGTPVDETQANEENVALIEDKLWRMDAPPRVYCEAKDATVDLSRIPFMPPANHPRDGEPDKQTSAIGRLESLERLFFSNWNEVRQPEYLAKRFKTPVSASYVAEIAATLCEVYGLPWDSERDCRYSERTGVFKINRDLLTELAALEKTQEFSISKGYGR